MVDPSRKIKLFYTCQSYGFMFHSVARVILGQAFCISNDRDSNPQSGDRMSQIRSQAY